MSLFQVCARINHCITAQQMNQVCARIKHCITTQQINQSVVKNHRKRAFVCAQQQISIAGSHSSAKQTPQGKFYQNQKVIIILIRRSIIFAIDSSVNLQHKNSGNN